MASIVKTDTGLTDLATAINAEHEQARQALLRGCEHAVKAGELLLEAKAKVKRGQWLPWLAVNCDVAERTAQLYMRLARNRDQLEADNADLGTVTVRAGAQALVTTGGTADVESATVADLALEGAAQALAAPRELRIPLNDLVDRIRYYRREDFHGLVDDIEVLPEKIARPWTCYGTAELMDRLKDLAELLGGHTRIQKQIKRDGLVGPTVIPAGMSLRDVLNDFGEAQLMGTWTAGGILNELKLRGFGAPGFKPKLTFEEIVRRAGGAITPDGLALPDDLDDDDRSRIFHAMCDVSEGLINLTRKPLADTDHTVSAWAEGWDAHCEHQLDKIRAAT